MLPCLKLVGSLTSHRLSMRSCCLGSWALAPHAPRFLSLCPPSPYCIQCSNFLIKSIDVTSTQWSQHHLQMEKIQSNPSSIPTTSHWQPTCHPVFPLTSLPHLFHFSQYSPYSLYLFESLPITSFKPSISWFLTTTYQQHPNVPRPTHFLSLTPRVICPSNHLHVAPFLQCFQVFI